MIFSVALALFSSDGKGIWNLDRGALIALGTFGLMTGSALFRTSALAWCASVLLQLLLTPVFFIGTVAFRPGLGLFLPLGINIPDVGNLSALFEFSIGVDFKVSLNAAPGLQYVAVNLAAVACLVLLILNRPTPHAESCA